MRAYFLGTSHTDDKRATLLFHIRVSERNLLIMLVYVPDAAGDLLS